MSFEDHPAERWSPMWQVPQGVECCFCGYPIKPGGPPYKTKTTAMRAWFNHHRRVWECIGCRQEAFRADMARRAEAAVKLAAERRSA